MFTYNKEKKNIFKQLPLRKFLQSVPIFFFFFFNDKFQSIAEKKGTKMVIFLTNSSQSWGEIILI